MIQRIQTIFLILALVALGLYLWLPLVRLEIPHSHFPAQEINGWRIVYHFGCFDWIPKFGRDWVCNYMYFINAILAGTAAVLTLINIFLFKNRSLQMLVCWFAIIFIIAAQAFVYHEYRTWVFLGDVILRKWNLFSLAALICELLALIYIRKDEEMIKSLDRLR